MKSITGRGLAESDTKLSASLVTLHKYESEIAELRTFSETMSLQRDKLNAEIIKKQLAVDEQRKLRNADMDFFEKQAADMQMELAACNTKSSGYIPFQGGEPHHMHNVLYSAGAPSAANSQPSGLSFNMSNGPLGFSAPASEMNLGPNQLDPVIASQPSELHFNSNDLSTQEALDQMIISHAAVTKAMKAMKQSDLPLAQVLDGQRAHINLLQEIAMIYTKIWFCFPLKTPAEIRERVRKPQQCGQCGETDGNWKGEHVDGSTCTATVCNVCKIMGLGVRPNGYQECNIHPSDKCPFHKNNILLFQELIKRRFEFLHKHLVPKKMKNSRVMDQSPIVPDDNFYAALLSDNDSENSDL